MLAPAQGELRLFPETQQENEAQQFSQSYGFVDLNKLKLFYPRLLLVEEIAEQHRFFHWELEFADVFLQRGGFDLMVGNPPWIKVEWNEGGVLGDADPLVVLRNLSASTMAQKREQAFEGNARLRQMYLLEYEDSAGTQNFLNAVQNYPLLKGIQTNLFKCFLLQAWMFSRSTGVSGFLHPEGVYDDPKGGCLRKKLYSRLRYHFQFQNEFALFVGTNDNGRMKFGLHIYGIEQEEQDLSFTSINNLFSPQTIDACFEPSLLAVPGIKNNLDKWNTTGHPSRVIKVNLEILKLFATLYNEFTTYPSQACLPCLHTELMVPVLRKFAKQSQRLGDLKDEYYATVMFDETNAVKKDHTIRRET